MHDKFKEHTRQTAFNLSLSQPQIDVILMARVGDEDGILSLQHHRSTLCALDRKGLMQERKLELTEAGYAVSSLLSYAGFSNE